MSQYHVGGVEGFKGTLRFNGTIDTPPTVNMTGPGTMTQDPPEERPTGTGGAPETYVVLHFRNSGTATGMVSIHAEAVVDNPETGDQVESISGDFADIAEWIAATQPKATEISFSTEAEPV